MSYAHDILLTDWTDLSGHEPAAGSDSLGLSRDHALDDGATATFTVSPTYTAGTELVLKLHEATASVSKTHAWEASVQLNGGTAEVFDDEFVAGTVADTLMYKTLAISSGGQINGVAIAGGDLVGITLTRVAASEDEDPEDLRLYAVSVGETLADLTVGGCAGRVGKLVDRIMKQTKEIRGTFITAAQCLAWINECKDDLAQEGCWPDGSDDIDMVASQATYSLTALVSDIATLTDLVWIATDTSLVSMSASDLQKVKSQLSGFTTYSQPMVYHQRGDEIELYPVPVSNDSAALQVKYDRIPDDLGCTEDFTPEFPAAFDKVFYHYALREYWDMDSGSKAGAANYMKHSQLYERAKADVLSRDVGDICIRPG
jgi:hypothetical protein